MIRLDSKERLHKGILKGIPYMVSLLATLLVYQMHMSKNVDSMLNEKNTILSTVFLKSQVKYHQEFAPFARRPLTSILIENISLFLDIEMGLAFVWVNFFFLFLSGFLIYSLSNKLKANSYQCLLNMMVYFLSFSVLFSFFPPVFSYDEPLQYCLILLALIAFVGQKWPLFVIFFTLALISRETSALLLPALLLFSPGLQNELGNGFKSRRLKQFTILGLPVLLYGIFICVYLLQKELWPDTKNELTDRLSCLHENFESPKNIVETITSLFLAIGPFLYLSRMYLSRTDCSVFGNRFIHAFLVTAAINTPIVILTAFARETRLFALPLIFIWPMFWQLFEKEIRLLFSFSLYPALLKSSRFLAPFVVLNAINYWFCFSFYTKFGLGSNNYFAEYLFILLFLISIHFLLNHFYEKNAEVKKSP